MNTNYEETILYLSNCNTNDLYNIKTYDNKDNLYKEIENKILSTINNNKIDNIEKINFNLLYLLIINNFPLETIINNSINDNFNFENLYEVIENFEIANINNDIYKINIKKLQNFKKDLVFKFFDKLIKEKKTYDKDIQLNNLNIKEKKLFIEEYSKINIKFKKDIDSLIKEINIKQEDIIYKEKIASSLNNEKETTDFINFENKYNFLYSKDSILLGMYQNKDFLYENFKLENFKLKNYLFQLPKEKEKTNKFFIDKLKNEIMDEENIEFFIENCLNTKTLNNKKIRNFLKKGVFKNILFNSEEINNYNKINLKQNYDLDFDEEIVDYDNITKYKNYFNKIIDKNEIYFNKTLNYIFENDLYNLTKFLFRYYYNDKNSKILNLKFSEKILKNINIYNIKFLTFNNFDEKLKKDFFNSYLNFLKEISNEKDFDEQEKEIFISNLYKNILLLNFDEKIKIVKKLLNMDNKVKEILNINNKNLNKFIIDNKSKFLSFYDILNNISEKELLENNFFINEEKILEYESLCNNDTNEEVYIKYFDILNNNNINFNDKILKNLPKISFNTYNLINYKNKDKEIFDFIRKNIKEESYKDFFNYFCQKEDSVNILKLSKLIKINNLDDFTFYYDLIKKTNIDENILYQIKKEIFLKLDEEKFLDISNKKVFSYIEKLNNFYFLDDKNFIKKILETKSQENVYYFILNLTHYLNILKDYTLNKKVLKKFQNNIETILKNNYIDLISFFYNYNYINNTMKELLDKTLYNKTKEEKNLFFKEIINNKIKEKIIINDENKMIYFNLYNVIVENLDNFDFNYFPNEELKKIILDNNNINKLINNKSIFNDFIKKVIEVINNQENNEKNNLENKIILSSLLKLEYFDLEYFKNNINNKEIFEEVFTFNDFINFYEEKNYDIFNKNDNNEINFDKKTFINTLEEESFNIFNTFKNVDYEKRFDDFINQKNKFYEDNFDKIYFNSNLTLEFILKNFDLLKKNEFFDLIIKNSFFNIKNKVFLSNHLKDLVRNSKENNFDFFKEIIYNEYKNNKKELDFIFNIITNFDNKTPFFMKKSFFNQNEFYKIIKDKKFYKSLINEDNNNLNNIYNKIYNFLDQFYYINEEKSELLFDNIIDYLKENYSINNKISEENITEDKYIKLLNNMYIKYQNNNDFDKMNLLVKNIKNFYQIINPESLKNIYKINNNKIKNNFIFQKNFIDIKKGIYLENLIINKIDTVEEKDLKYFIEVNKSEELKDFINNYINKYEVNSKEFNYSIKFLLLSFYDNNYDLLKEDYKLEDLNIDLLNKFNDLLISKKSLNKENFIFLKKYFQNKDEFLYIAYNNEFKLMFDFTKNKIFENYENFKKFNQKNYFSIKNKFLNNFNLTIDTNINNLDDLSIDIKNQLEEIDKFIYYCDYDKQKSEKLISVINNSGIHFDSFHNLSLENIFNKITINEFNNTFELLYKTLTNNNFQESFIETFYSYKDKLIEENLINSLETLTKKEIENALEFLLILDNNLEDIELSKAISYSSRSAAISNSFNKNILTQEEINELDNISEELNDKESEIKDGKLVNKGKVPFVKNFVKTEDNYYITSIISPFDRLNYVQGYATNSCLNVSGAARNILFDLPKDIYNWYSLMIFKPFPNLKEQLVQEDIKIIQEKINKYNELLLQEDNPLIFQNEELKIVNEELDNLIIKYFYIDAASVCWIQDNQTTLDNIEMNEKTFVEVDGKTIRTNYVSNDLIKLVDKNAKIINDYALLQLINIKFNNNDEMNKSNIDTNYPLFTTLGLGYVEDNLKNSLLKKKKKNFKFKTLDKDVYSDAKENQVLIYSQELFDMEKQDLKFIDKLSKTQLTKLKKELETNIYNEINNNKINLIDKKKNKDNIDINI